MQVTGVDGRTISIHRRWMPWRLHKRDLGVHGDGDFILIPDADSLEGFAFALVMMIVWVLVGGLLLSFTILFSEAALLLLLLLPMLAVARMFWILPWVIRVTHGDTVLGQVRVRGWRDSEDRIRELAAAYQHGNDPFTPGGRA